MTEVLSIILLVFGVLQIVLFFKIWGMTNNVSKLTGILEYSYSFKYYLITGDKESAYKKAVAELYSELARETNFATEGIFKQKAVPAIDACKDKLKMIDKTLSEYLASADLFWETYKKF